MSAHKVFNLSFTSGISDLQGSFKCVWGTALKSIHDIVARIVEFYGFSVTKSAEDAIYAEKNGSTIVIGLGPKQLESDECLIDFKASVKENVKRYFFATLGDVSKELRDAAKRMNIAIWDREYLQKEIGKTVLAEASSDMADGERCLFSDGDFEEVVEISPEDEADFGETEDMVEIVEPSSGKTASVIDATPQPVEEKIMELNYSIEDITEMSKRIVQGFRFDLRLVPHYVFNYACELLVEGTLDTEEKKGVVAVNGLTNDPQEWPESYRTVSNLTTSHTKLEPQIGIKAAFVSALELATSLNTTEREFVDNRESVTIYEKRKVRPKDGAIDISSVGLIYQPLWCIEGANGIMVIDGTTGKVIKEDLYRETDRTFLR